MSFVTQLKRTQLKRTVYQGRDPIWIAAWVSNGEESGYSSYSLHALLKEVVKLQGEGK